MADIVLATLNAKYIHTAFGLRYLLANLGALQSSAEIVEADINQRPLEVAEVLLARSPRLLGLGVYVWNAAETLELVMVLKRLRPDLTIILGGPEASFEHEAQPLAGLAGHVITGEADLAFADVCERLLKGESLPKIIPAPLPDLARVALPYDLYTSQDLAHRVVYVEASRGCPFSCEFCLSSLDIPVRTFPLEPFLAAMQRLLDRGLLHFKFVDRTFNLNLRVSQSILEFFLARLRPGLFLHFEMVPDRLPVELRGMMARFPPGALQLEIGVQTFDAAAAGRIQRRQDMGRLEDNFRFLRQHTGAHVHADLIAGLPGEDLASFAAGFDRLLALGPQEIQVGILKRLRGTAIGRHDAEWGMVYNPLPPYDLLENRLIPFAQMQRVRRLARYWDLLGNSGNFRGTLPWLWQGEPSAFAALLRLSDWLFAQTGRTDSLALPRLAALVFEYLREVRGLPASALAQSLLEDYQRPGRRDVPLFLRACLPAASAKPASMSRSALLRRQARHQNGGPQDFPPPPSGW